jgi:hypothetical protein
VITRIQELREQGGALDAGATLWSGRHLVRTDGAKVDFREHPPGTVFWAPQSLPASSPICTQFKRRDLPVTRYDYPPAKDRRAWLVAQLRKRELDTSLADTLLEATGADYARLHMEIDRLALAPKSAWQLVPSSLFMRTFIDAWLRGDCGAMHNVVHEANDDELHALHQTLLAAAHEIYAVQEGHGSELGAWQARRARSRSKVPRGWARVTLKVMGQVPPTRLAMAEALCRLDRAKRRAA